MKMTEQNKNLLLRDLCARLPYGVMVQWPVAVADYHFQDHIIELCPSDLECDGEILKIKNIKPYLRPMSSMTEEEVREIDAMPTGEDVDLPNGYGLTWIPNIEMADWLNAHHLDYRGLIDKGLAIEVTEQNNPYKD